MILSGNQLQSKKCYLEWHSNGQLQVFYIEQFYQNKSGRAVKILLAATENWRYIPQIVLSELYPKKVYREISQKDMIKAIFGDIYLPSLIKGI